MSTRRNWSVGLSTLALLAGGLFAFVRFAYPEWKAVVEAEAENRLLSAQVQKLQAESEDLGKRLESSRAEYIQASSENKRLQQMLDFQSQQLTSAARQIADLGAANVRLNSLADIGNRCAPYKKDLDEVQDELAGRAFGRVPDAERKAQLAVLIEQASGRLTTCLSAGK